MVRAEEEKVVLERLCEAVKILEEGMPAALLPAGGSSLGFALRGARGPEDVAGVAGGLVREEGQVRPSGRIAFGAGEGAARVVLTAMRTDPGIRSAAVIRFFPQVLEVLEGLLLETCGFDRSREPPGVSTMDWGVAFCCREGVPDVIFDRGAPGKEGLVRILGEDPVKVARTVIAVSRGLPGDSGS